MSQISFADAEYAGKRKKTRREVFLDEMELVVPWKALLKVIEPFYPVAGRGRRPYPLESMLRVHLMQNWFALSDPAMEEALYEIASLRRFASARCRPFCGRRPKFLDSSRAASDRHARAPNVGESRRLRSSRRHLVECRQFGVEVVPRQGAHAIGHHLRLVAARVVQACRVDGEDLRHGRKAQVDR